LFAAALRGRDLQQPKVPPRWTLTTAEAVANRAVRAIYRNERLVVMQPISRALYLTKRFFPGLLDLAHRMRRRRKTASAPVAPQSQAHPPRRVA
jgi:hypothetical protein